MEFYGNTQKEEVVSHEMLHFLYIQKVTSQRMNCQKVIYKTILLKKPIFFSKTVQQNSYPEKVATREEELKPIPANYPHGYCWAGFILASDFPHKLSANILPCIWVFFQTWCFFRIRNFQKQGQKLVSSDALAVEVLHSRQFQSPPMIARYLAVAPLSDVMGLKTIGIFRIEQQ